MTIAFIVVIMVVAKVKPEYIPKLKIDRRRKEELWKIVLKLAHHSFDCRDPWWNLGWFLYSTEVVVLGVWSISFVLFKKGFKKKESGTPFFLLVQLLEVS